MQTPVESLSSIDADIEDLFAKGLRLYRQDTGGAKNVAEHLTQISSTHNSSRGRVRAANLNGLIAISEERWADALRQLLHAQNLCEPLDDPLCLAQIMNGLQRVYQITRNYADALECAYASLRLAQEACAEADIAKAKHGIGFLLLEEGDVQSALTWLDQSLTMKMRLGDEESIAYTLGAIGDALSRLGDDDNAIYHLRASIHLSRKLKNLSAYGSGLASIGLIYRSQQRWSLARRYIHAALHVQHRLSNPYVVPRLYGYLIDIYAALGHSDLALCAGNKAVERGTRIDDQVLLRETTASRSQLLT